ncbi:MAG: GIY-YIG nuclease family protein [Chloroflexi bacterium]|nr:GIY-YIG nuclease family protein [Chloroflexota bacterium]
MNSYYIYILGNRKGALHVGITNDMERRIYEHKKKLVKGFTRKYNLNQLLFMEEFSDIYQALDAEKQIKGWLRKKKLALIRTMNPKFEDLSKDWQDH